MQASSPNAQRLNGHAKSGEASGGKPGSKENIFLFYPNIIGEYRWLHVVYMTRNSV